MKIHELQEKKRILIVGYGLEGKAVHAFLTQHCPNVPVGIADQKDGPDYLSTQHEYDLAIKSPGVHPELIKIPYTTTMNIFFANARGKIIGVTGTKGKSTTMTLIYEILKNAEKDVHLGGNIGRSPLDFLDNLNEHSWTVLELSSFHLQDITMSPHIAVLLRITPEHIDYHKSEQSYIDAKRNILKFQTEHDYAVINRDYPATNESDIYTNAKVWYISRERETDNACFSLNGKIIVRKNGSDDEIIKTSEILLLGKHNLENICAAVMAAKLAGVGDKHIVAALKSFTGLPHRLEFVGEVYGVRYYNDSLATIPDAVIEALETFGSEAETLIAGGHDRGSDYTDLGKYLAKSSVRNLIVLGPSGKRIWEAVIAAGGEKMLKKIEVETMDKAVFFASEETSPGKVCLLSPGAASFGMFRDYKDRGEQFIKAVSALKV